MSRLLQSIFSICFVVVCVVLIVVIVPYRYQIHNTISYATRPLWDKATGPQQLIPHFHAEELPVNAYTCQLHGWTERSNARDIKVLDAVLMSSELDLLEIRLNELDPVVDQFFILESNATFTGLPKETYFANNRQRFAKFEHKISYHFMPGYALKPGQGAFDVEALTRDTMTMMLQAQIPRLSPWSSPLVIMSDIDEIPSAHTIKLLKGCDYGKSIHLQLRNYLYSFEWLIDLGSWRSSVQLWSFDSYYRHSKSTELILADAGWHCSYCFRTIPEYVVKMQGFSHADRIGGRINLLEPKRIQQTICRGKDIFGMLPEAYRYADLLAAMNPVPQSSAIGLPKHVLLNAQRFKFLLPGGCKRES